MAVFELQQLLQHFSVKEDKSSLEATLHIPPDLLAFDGHFPNEPILPGIVQISIARELVEKALDSRVEMKEVQRARMSELILPNDDIQIKMTLSEETENLWRAKASVIKANKTASRFNFLVETQPKNEG